MAKPWENNSGAKDPTAYEGSKRISKEERELKKLMKAIHAMAEAMGYRVTNRIEFMEIRTERMFR